MTTDGNTREKIAAPKFMKRENIGSNHISITTSFLTPMFGGGVWVDGHIRPHDPVTPIRGTAVRGNLRTWWRAARAGQFGTVQKLREREFQLWGEASKPGLVQIAIDASNLVFEKETSILQTQASGHSYQARSVVPRDPLTYVGFPLQPKQELLRYGTNCETIKIWKGDIKIDLRLPPSASQEDLAEVEAAAWAWLMFGGLGGRTRRGFGALSVDEKLWDFKTHDVLRSKYIIQHEPPQKGIYSLYNAHIRELTSPSNSYEQRWRSLIGKLRDFRQGPDIGRNKGGQPNRPGRSRWPEPELIRAQTGMSAPDHRSRFVNVDKAPRAQFGMPIIFHFQKHPNEKEDTKRDSNAREPYETSLQLRHKVGTFKRMASPLILKPYGNSKKVGGMALVLGNRVPLGVPEFQVEFTRAGEPKFTADPNLTQAEAQKLSVPFNKKTDPLLAFLDYVAPSP